MTSELHPYHAHIYFDPRERAAADRLHRMLSERKGTGDLTSVTFVGEARDQPVGPHPKPQFEVHFREDSLAAMLSLIHATGLTALVHPLTNDDLADHTSLARWIGKPISLDLSVLDPPGMNQGVERFGKSDF